MKSRSNLLCLLFLMVGQISSQQELMGQSENGKIQLLAKSFGDSIVLRWGIDHINLWDASRSNGYQIERMALDHSTNTVVENFRTLKEQPIIPWSKEQIVSELQPGDSSLALVYKSLYQPFEKAYETSDFIEKLSLISQERHSRFTMMMMAADLDRKAATAAGLRYVDRDVKSDLKYIYRISIPSMDNVAICDSTYFILRSESSPPEPAMFRPEAFPGNREILIRWKVEDRFTAYFIERSEDLKEFKPIHGGPIMPWLNREDEELRFMTFSDSIPKNGKAYHYRIRGLTAFAEYSPWSEPVQMNGVDQLTLLSPNILEVENTIGRELEIKWEVDEVEPVAGFWITHAVGRNLQFLTLHQEMLPANQRSFRHGQAQEFSPNYYRVIAVYESGKVIQSDAEFGAVLDQAPPQAPEGLNGSIDEDGVVTLKWNPNREQDLQGYFILTAHQKDHEFANLTSFPVQEIQFQDTVNLRFTTENRYYTIQAKDKSGRLSAFSDTILIIKPDLVPPSAPTIANYEVFDSMVSISWHASTSKDLDHHVIVQRKDGSEWQEIAKAPRGQSRIHLKISSKEVTEIAIYAVDDANLKSTISHPIGVRPIRPTYPLVISNFRGQVTAEVVELTWTTDFENKSGRYLLYRSINGSAFKKYKTLKASDVVYRDLNVTQGNSYRYDIQFRADSGEKTRRTTSNYVALN